MLSNIATTAGCISFDSYIKPQPGLCCRHSGCCCISFDSYIKPQPSTHHAFSPRVVYLLIPTSNHNRGADLNVVSNVVYLLIPTSNHNCPTRFLYLRVLYIFWFLHQTTTDLYCFLQQMCCISFDSYIKPQLSYTLLYLRVVVYLLIPTSNHNL